MKDYDVTCRVVIEVKIRGVRAESPELAAFAAGSALTDRFDAGVSTDLVTVEDCGIEYLAEVLYDGDNIEGYTVEEDDGNVAVFDTDINPL